MKCSTSAYIKTNLVNDQEIPQLYSLAYGGHGNILNHSAFNALFTLIVWDKLGNGFDKFLSRCICLRARFTSFFTSEMKSSLTTW